MHSIIPSIVSTGDMADRVRRHDWAQTSLGPMGTWPAGVRVAINNLLSSPFPACACFGDALTMVYNDAFVPILAKKHPALGQSFQQVWAEAWDDIGPLARGALAGETVFIKDFPLTTNRDGQPAQAFFTFSYSPLHDENGAVIGMLDTVFESTEAVAAGRRLEARASILEYEVVQQTDARQQAEHALQEARKLESIGRLAGGVAHDFNNLLQVISGNLQILELRMGTDAAAQQRLQSARAGVERGARLAGSLLAFSRKQTLDPSVCNVSELVAGMEDMIRVTLGGSCVLRMHWPERSWNVLVDTAQLENVVLNLCLNARDAMAGGGRLDIEVDNVRLDATSAQGQETQLDGDFVAISVRDTGAGMSPEVMAQAFEPFFTTKPDGKGTGLGLSTAFGFVKQSGGHLLLQSEPGLGTTATVYLPRSFDTAQAIRWHPDDEPAGGGTETVLVVEDESQVQDTVVELLRGLGYAVLRSSGPGSALAVLESGLRIDLLFTDVVMPGPVRANELAAAARKLQPGIAVLFTSGYTQGAGLDAGGDLLPKPYSREALARKVRQALARRQGLAAR